jgi:hypothetical protein
MGGEIQSDLDSSVPPLRCGGARRHDMIGARLTIDEAKAFLDANPGVQWIDAFIFDMNGIPRGKRMRRSDLPGAVTNGIMMPTSVFIMDPLGNCEETGWLWERRFGPPVPPAQRHAPPHSRRRRQARASGHDGRG